MLGVFLDVVLPIFLLALAGAALQRYKQFTITPINQLAVYLLTPSLLFNGLTRTTLSAEEGLKIGLFVAVQIGLMIFVGGLAARVGRLDQHTASAFLLGATFCNCGNYGLPISALALGDAGLERATVFFVGQTVFTGTVAIFIASRGSTSTWQALANVFKTPIIYATVGALILRAVDVQVPTILAIPVKMAADAALPVMLILLGAQLAMMRSLEGKGPLAALSAIRLVAAPALAAVVSGFFGFPALTRDVVILQSAMPTAVVTIIYAAEFGARPALLTASVFVTTLLSLVSLTVLLALLGARA